MALLVIWPMMQLYLSDQREWVVGVGRDAEGDHCCQQGTGTRRGREGRRNSGCMCVIIKLVQVLGCNTSHILLL